MFTAREEETAEMPREIWGVRPPLEKTTPEPVTLLTRPKELVAKVVKVWVPLAVLIESKGPEVAKVWVEEVEPFKEAMPAEPVPQEAQAIPPA